MWFRIKNNRVMKKYSYYNTLNRCKKGNLENMFMLLLFLFCFSDEQKKKWFNDNTMTRQKREKETSSYFCIYLSSNKRRLTAGTNPNFQPSENDSDCFFCTYMYNPHNKVKVILFWNKTFSQILYLLMFNTTQESIYFDCHCLSYNTNTINPVSHFQSH